MSRPTTWRVQYHREDSPHPVSHYYYGQDAETRARAKADNLQHAEEARGVTVEPITPPDPTRRPFLARDLLAAPPNRLREKSSDGRNRP